MRIHLILNLFRPDAVQAAHQAVKMLRARNIVTGADRESAHALEIEAVPSEHLADCDLMITFGGDGTLLTAAHLCSAKGTPILGVYYGRFGFVTQCFPEDLGPAISTFVDGSALIEERLMLKTELRRGQTIVASLHSLNEAVVQRAATARMLTFDVDVNGTKLARYPSDGVMVATPTGSTAYNLSAGGPIVDPRLDALVLTAIMPHTLASRPLILSADARIDIRVEARGDAVLSCDGQSRLHLLSGDSIRITQSERKTRLVTVDPDDFFTKISNKFRWSEGPLSE
ncbi:MAG: NAD(+)/NADH kinase [Fimbriimonadaceae bacterium]|nr:NAD(+)/NADH kinase [Fimbriimonadaceae bacterium]